MTHHCFVLSSLRASNERIGIGETRRAPDTVSGEREVEGRGAGTRDRRPQSSSSKNPVPIDPGALFGLCGVAGVLRRADWRSASLQRPAARDLPSGSTGTGRGWRVWGVSGDGVQTIGTVIHRHLMLGRLCRSRHPAGLQCRLPSRFLQRGRLA
jgi:hypothetical protein